MFKGLRRNRLKATPLSAQQRRIIETHWPFFLRLPEADQNELAAHTQVFLAEKGFEGCGGLVIGDEHRVCIAAQACLLLLRRETDYYPELQTILVYPSTYVVPTTRHVGSGVMRESREVRAGESWRLGAIVLAWDEVCDGMASPEIGHNVVLHEFAHQLDYEDGEADGIPLVGRGESLAMRRRRYAEWRQVMLREFEQLRVRVQRGENNLLRDYGATNGAEFFAVATECFFCKPRELRQRHPELYQQMSWYYKQDPAGWGGA